VTGGTDSDSEGEEEEGDDDDDDDDDDEVEPPKVLGDMLESLAGAVFMDSGMDLQAVWSCLGPLFEEKIGEIDRPEYFVNLMDYLPEGICINKGSLKG
jgi:dsRNA-specific ribonuclease